MAGAEVEVMKACERCHGCALMVDSDGTVTCLLCGHRPSEPQREAVYIHGRQAGPARTRRLPGAESQTGGEPVMAWLFKSCPICRGDLYTDPLDPAFFSCLLCGRSWTPVQLGEAIGKVEGLKAEAVA